MDSRLKFLPRLTSFDRSGDAESYTELADGRASPREQTGEIVKNVSLKFRPEWEPHLRRSCRSSAARKNRYGEEKRPYPKPTQVVKLSKLR